MFLNYLAWRESYGVDDLARQSPMPFDDVIESIISHRLHGVDRRGRPLYFQRTGAIDAADFLARVPEAVLILTHVHFMERCQQALQAASERSGVRQTKVVNLIDLSGMTLGHARMLKVFRYTATADQSFYPEQLAAFYMLNAPSFLPVIFNAARPYLDARTQEKVFIVAKGDLQSVMAELGVECVPREYGGECECEGGCVPPVAHDRRDDEEVKAYEAGAKEEAVNVPAGRTWDTAMEVQVGPGQEARVWWKVLVERKDVGVQLLWVTADGEVTPLCQARKVDAGDREGVVRGAYTLTESDGAGKLKLVLDNAYSRFTSKDVRYMLGVRMSEVQLDEAIEGLSVADDKAADTVNGGGAEERTEDASALQAS